ncbi:mucin-17-like, partial [Aphis craccivora]
MGQSSPIDEFKYIYWLMTLWIKSFQSMRYLSSRCGDNYDVGRNLNVCEIETPNSEIKNVELTVPVVCSDEELILTPAPSAELMTEAISFVETDTNTPVETITSDNETPGIKLEKVEVAPSVVSSLEKQTLSPREESDNYTETTIIETDKTYISVVPSRKKKSRFLSALRRGLRRVFWVFRTVCGCGCSVKSSNHPDEEDNRDEFVHEI